ncbi:hypothetical protein KKF63_03420 [bacterium]|nr:hypothetical protein [bacterium]
MLQKSETWDMMGIAFNRQWAFCDPNAAFDLLITSLECYVNTADTSDDNARVIDLLKTSFVASRTAIVDQALLYKKESDCTQTYSTPLDDPDLDFVIPTYGGD